MHGMRGRCSGGGLRHISMEENSKKKLRLHRWLWPESQARRTLLLAGLIVAGIVGLFSVSVSNWSNTSDLTDLASIFASVVTVVAIVLGGVFALVKLQAFREFEPHLTVTHKVFHRIISDKYVHIDVAATLHNSSKVQIEINKGFFRVQKVSPLPDETIEELYSQVFLDQEELNMQWPKLDEVHRTWYKGELVVEPGESHPETYEFIVSRDVEAVLIYSYFYNSKFGMGRRSAQGWHATTVIDIIKKR